MTLRAPLQKLKDVHQRFGLWPAIQYFFYRLANQIVFVERLNVIVLDRDRLKPLKPGGAVQLSSRLATLQDLEALRKHPIWEIDDEKIEYFQTGDSCLLSYAGETLAGYTWAHTLGHPELLPGLTISVPDAYLYNYAGLTLPEFRGLGMQPFRHHALLNHEKWQNKKALLGYVKYMNFSSRHGQEKSGYRTIGSIWMFGSTRNFRVYVSRSLRNIGVRRLQPVSRTPAAHSVTG